MKKTLIISLLAATFLSAGNLTVTQGVVKAHTEVFGDSTIDPETTGLVSHLKMDNDPQTLNGSIDVSIKGLKSDNEDRDKHMYEAINSTKFPQATYKIQSITKSAQGYNVAGILDFHGIQKPLSILAQITQSGDTLQFNGKSSFLMSSYGVEPPRLLLLTVRDQVDLTIDVTFKNK